MIFVALVGELLFRGLLSVFMEKSGYPKWCGWIVPGVLFGLMHTLIPAITGTRTAVIVLSSIGGMLVYHCIFYALRRWSGTLLIHAALDFTGVFVG